MCAFPEKQLWDVQVSLDFLSGSFLERLCVLDQFVNSGVQWNTRVDLLVQIGEFLVHDLSQVSLAERMKSPLKFFIVKMNQSNKTILMPVHN